jgi:hypothetical protein
MYRGLTGFGGRHEIVRASAAGRPTPVATYPLYTKRVDIYATRGSRDVTEAQLLPADARSGHRATGLAAAGRAKNE